MTLQQLSYFVAIQQYGGFTAAAEELYISQSSLSKSMISLEKELEVKLFLRNSGKTRLSGAGEKLLPYAMEIVENFNSINEICRTAAFDEEHRLSLGGGHGLNAYGITNAVFNFEKKNPKYQIDMREIRTADVINQLRNGSIDIGIAVLKFPLKDDLEDLKVIPLIDDKPLLLMSKLNRIAKSSLISLESIKNQTFIQVNNDPILASYYTEAIKKYCPSAPVQLFNMTIDSVRPFIVEKGRVSLVAEKVARSIVIDESIVAVPIKEEIVLTLCILLSKNEGSKKGMLLAKYLKEKFPDRTCFRL